MSADVSVSLQWQCAPRTGSLVPIVGPVNLNLTLQDKKEPYVTTIEIQPDDVFGDKLLTLPAHVVSDQSLFLLTTDKPVKIRLTDNADTPVTFEKTLLADGFLILPGGTPAVATVDFEGISTSLPEANVTVFVVG